MMDEMIKVLITGEVHSGKGKLTGIVAMPITEAERLVKLGVAEPVDGIVFGDEDTALAMTHAHETLERQSKQIDDLVSQFDQALARIKELEELNGKLSQENVSLADKCLVHEKTIEKLNTEISALKAKPAKAEKK
jgi:septal ring factor EnvC (AmiA/AmiB activator)